MKLIVQLWKLRILGTLSLSLLIGACDFSRTTDVIGGDPIVQDSEYAYFLSGGDVRLCEIANDYSLDNCLDAEGGPYSDPASITFTKDGNFAYIANATSNNILVCPVDSDHTLGVCTITAGSAALNFPYDVVLDRANDFAYISSAFNDLIYVCEIAVDHTLVNCDNTGSGFNEPLGLSMNANSSRIYVANRQDDSISVCNVNSSNGSLSGCATTGNALGDPFRVLADAGNALAYVLNSTTDDVFRCSISNADLLDCALAVDNVGFNGIAFNAQRTGAYIADSDNDNINFCSLDHDGTLDDCQIVLSGGLVDPADITLQ